MKNNVHLPGAMLHRLARVLLDEDDLVRAAEPAIADLQHEGSAGSGTLAAMRARARVIALISLLIVRARAARFVSTPWAALIPAAVAVMTGALALREEAPLAAFGATQLLFLAVGLFVAVCAGTTRFARWERAAGAFGLFAVLALGAVFVAGDEIEGTRRWLRLGPLHVQLALAVWPLFLAALSGLMRRGRAWGAAALAASALALLAVERDTLACATWAIGGAVVAACERGARARWRVGIIATMVLFATWAITSAPRLAPLAHVEGVWALVASRGWGPTAVAAQAACFVPAAPLVLAYWGRRQPPCTTSLGVAAALAAFAASPLLLPDEPVALFGYGGSAIIGTFLALGIVLASARDATCSDGIGASHLPPNGT